MKQTVKRNIETALLIVIFVVGLSLILYPTVSDYWNSFHQSQAVSDYAQQVEEMDEEESQGLLEAAREFNQALAARGGGLTLSESERLVYESMLTIEEGDPISYIEIPSIRCVLPIYHGSEESVLQIGVGHIEGSSLPVGGESTHCVLSGHRGLPSAKLFSRLDELVEGDIFIIRTLGEVLTYQVDQILIVEPDDTEALRIVAGKDYCTLVTCTPYGVNTHRLLVRGERIENLAISDSARVTADALQIEPVLVAPFAAVPIIICMVLWLNLQSRKKGRKTKENSSPRKDDEN
jgi:sortase A